MSESKIVKGIAADISPELLATLERVFSEKQALYNPTEDASQAQLAYYAGCAYVVSWSKKHARTTVTPI